MMANTMVSLYLTKEQCEALGRGGYDHGDPDHGAHDVVIELREGGGGILIHAAEHLLGTPLDRVGSGVWMDADGSEHFSGGEPFAKSEKATEFYARQDGGEDMFEEPTREQMQREIKEREGA